MSRSASHFEANQSPSRWDRRAAATGLALTGCGIATYLTLYQVRVLPEVWEPFFGEGSRHILRESALSRMLPIPDAAVGAAVYLIEAVAESLGGRERWRTAPAAVLVAGVAAVGLALAALALVACQLFWFHAYCTLCLASALCSLAVFGLVAPEVWSIMKHYQQTHRNATPAREGMRLT